MVHVRHPYQSESGQIKLSRANGVSSFKNITRGIALKYVKEGQELYLINDEYVKLSAGQFILLDSNQRYQALTNAHHALTRGICIDLDPDFVADHVPHLMEEELWFNIPLQGQNYLSLPQTFDKLGQKDLRLEGEDVLHQLRNGLNDLTHQLSSLKDPIQSQAKKAKTQKALLSRLLVVKDYIACNFCQAISLKELGQLSGLSIFRLNRSFQHCFGLTPQQYQLQLRMEEACKLLSQDDIRLTEIAFRLGYSDLAAFSNQFKKYHQLSPSHFRKRL
ncbi:MAG: AraC family transcriptional regulator [Bacteroidota bacterium]